MGAKCCSILQLFLVFYVVTLPSIADARNFIIVWEDDDIRKENYDYGSNNGEESINDMSNRSGLFGFVDTHEPTLEWDEFGDHEETNDHALDPGSWIHVLEHEDGYEQPNEVSTSSKKSASYS